MKSKKRQMFAILLAGDFLLVSGCISKDTPESETESYDLEMTVYLDPVSEDLIKSGVGRFTQSTLLNIKWNLVDCTDMSSKEFRQKLEQDRKKGEGPDILFFNSFTCADPNLELRSGDLLDITDFTEELQESNGDYLTERMVEAASYEGKCYLQPICFQLPIFLGLQSVVEEVGFQPEAFSDIFGLLEETSRLMEGEIPMFDQPGVLEELVCRYSGISLIDYDTGEMQLDSPEFQKLCEEYQKLYEWDHAVEERNPGYTAGYQALWNRKAVFTNSHQENVDYFASDLLAANYQNSSVLLPVKGVGGEPVAVITNSAGIWAETEHPEEAIQFLDELRNFVSYSLYPGSMPAFPWWNWALFWADASSIQPRYQYSYPLDIYGIPMEPYDGDVYHRDYVETEYTGLITADNPAVFETDLIKKGGLLEQHMEPFFQGTESYEDCVQKLEDSLKEHISYGKGQEK